MKTYLSLGLMSGTSMDGIDGAIIKTDGQSFIESHSSLFLPYSWEFQSLLKIAEYAVHAECGNLQNVRKNFNTHIESYFRHYLELSNNEYDKNHQALKKYCGEINFDNIVQHSTKLHINLVKMLLEKTSLTCNDVNVIGYHGQTLYHAPKQACTIQVGDAKTLAEECKVKVVYDFRSNDIRHGGEGAPFAPVYHQALVKRDNLEPCLVINCGGISNVTFCHDNELLAFDIGPGNCLLDQFIQRKRQGQHQMDHDGMFSLKGQVQMDMLQILWKRACVVNETNYFELDLPKSLDIHDLTIPNVIMNLSIEDGAATLAYFTAECIAKSLDLLGSFPTHSNCILAGGGWKNPSITHSLKSLLPSNIKISSASKFNWSEDMLEAEIFAYLAVRSLEGLPLSFPNTTGVKKPVAGGVLIKA